MSLLKSEASDFNVKPNKLIRQELCKCPKSEHLSHSEVRLFRKKMYEVRRESSFLGRKTSIKSRIITKKELEII